MLTVSQKDPYKKFFAAHVMVTGRCNLDCYYCYYPSRPGPELTLNQIDQVISEFESLDEREIFYEVSGGEPMIRSDWCSVTELFLDTGRDVVFSTNGTLIDQREAEKLLKLYQKYGDQLYLSISLDSHDQIVHNSIRGLYTEALRGMECLRNFGVPFRVSITLTRYNLETLTETVRFVVDNLTREVMIGILRPVFPMTQDNRVSILSLEEVQAAYLKIEALRDQNDFEFYHCLGKDGQPGCLAGFDRVAIGSNGDIFPCYALRHIVLGNVFTEGLQRPLSSFRESIEDKPVRDLLCEKSLVSLQEYR